MYLSHITRIAEDLIKSWNRDYHFPDTWNVTSLPNLLQLLSKTSTLITLTQNRSVYFSIDSYFSIPV